MASNPSVAEVEPRLLGREYGPEFKVPFTDRTYRFIDLFFIWFGAGIVTGNWYLGGLFAAQGLPKALLYNFLINVLTLFPWAAVGYIAYREGTTTIGVTRMSLGTPASRTIPSAYAMIFAAGWTASNTFIGAISVSYIMQTLVGWPAYLEPGGNWTMVFGIVILIILQGVFVGLGHNLIKWMELISGVAVVVLGIWMTVVIFQNYDLADLWAWRPEAGSEYMSAVLIIDLIIASNLTWLAIGDFSRFAKTGKNAYWGPLAGLGLGQSWTFTLGSVGVIGAVLATGAFDPNRSDPSSTLASLGLAWMAFLILAFTTVNTNAVLMYGGGLGLNAMTKMSARKGLWIMTIVCSLACFAPLLMDSFLTWVTNLITFLGGLVVPLWALVLVDYFVVRRRQANEEDLFAEGGGTRYRYTGGFNLYGIAAWAAGGVLYWTICYILPESVQNAFPASIPAFIVTAVLYWILGTVARNNGYIKI